ncbi:MAG: tRNA adenosine(34) deaminase TadA [Ignavibacteriae bacterium]|nr:tRNA adenosine(34) deaminase TadA [Ignavibacteriota bacterium]MCB9217272.1 nucleoside deaminase [Ignavibacteria bacterium]
MSIHQHYMRKALQLAEEAFGENEVPVGAIVVRDGEVIGRGRNRTVAAGEPTQHAEIIAIRDACRHLARERLDGSTLYVTLEPCPMCAGAIVLARLAGLFFGAYDEKAGAAETLYAITTDRRLNHQVETHGGVLDHECAAVLSRFFAAKRGR